MRLLSDNPGSHTWAAYLRRLSRESTRFVELAAVVRSAQPWLASWPDIQKAGPVGKLLLQLESSGFRESRLIEISDPPPPFEGPIVVAVSPEKLKPGGYVYAGAILDEAFPDFVIGLFEIRAFARKPQPEFSWMSEQGWKTVGRSGISRHTGLRVAIAAVKALCDAKPNVGHTPMREAHLLSLRRGVSPRTDPELARRLQAVLTNKMPAVLATVEFSALRLHDTDYAFTISEALVDVYCGEVRAKKASALLVYWDGTHYVSSDDHVLYLALRRLRVDRVIAAILGEPGPVLKIHRRGGAELIPPVGTVSELPDEKVAKWNWQLRETRRLPSRGYVELNLIYIQLAKLLESSSREKELHELLKSSPAALDVYGSQVRSEVRLGRQYRVDLLMSYSGSNARLLLVELEAASQQFFTKKGRWRAPIVHAIQQVEDWLRWWQEHPALVPKDLDGSLPVYGLVVAGRSRDLSPEEVVRLAHLNQGKRIQVVTFDDLLAQLDSLLSVL